MNPSRSFSFALLVLSCAGLALAGCKDEGPYFIQGSARLPDCTDPPAFDLDGTEWFDQGDVTIQTTGCGTAQPMDVIEACALNWVMSQVEGEIEIIVGGEYRIRGRLCGPNLHLHGGWWLPVVDEDEGYCTYEEDSADEVGIQDGGSVLTVALQPGSSMLQASGVLSVSGSCDAEYDMVLTQ